MHDYESEFYDEELEDDSEDLEVSAEDLRNQAAYDKFVFDEKKYGARKEYGQEAIKIIDGDLPHIMKAINKVLADPKHGIFQRNGQLVRLAKMTGKGDLSFVPFCPEDLQVALSGIISWCRWDGRRHMDVKIDCPLGIARNFLALKGAWSVPHVHAIVSAPTMRPDGSILDQPGLDVATGIYLDTRGVEFTKVPDRPTQEKGLAALAMLKDLVREVPFVKNDDGLAVSRSVFLSALLTAVIRAALPAAPLHGFNAPQAGSGKSMLVQSVGIVQTGEKYTSIAADEMTEGELEKKIGTELRKNGAYLAIDNMDTALSGALFCQLLTEEWVNIRILGKSESFTVKNTAMFIANGNSLTVKADMVRRVLRSTIDPECEKPEAREFETERPDVLAMRNRPQLVVAALTALRAYMVAGQPGGTPPLGSFEVWSRMVRDALIWYGEADPVLSQEETRAEDPERAKIATLCREWWRVITDKKVRVQEIIEAALAQVQDMSEMGRAPYKLQNRDFKEALAAVADNGIGGIDKQAIGNWLGKHKNQIVEGFKIVPAGKRDGYPQWQVINLNAESDDREWQRQFSAS
jgi:putative DNA primase/helicase